MTTVLIIALALLATGCNNNKKKLPVTNSNLIILTPGGKNKASMSDTMVIYEAVCRGCEYEESTEFVITDSLNLVKMVRTETIDNNPPDIDGGTVDKHIYLVPVKPGHTQFKVFKFDSPPQSAADSLAYRYYEIEIKE